MFPRHLKLFLFASPNSWRPTTAQQPWQCGNKDDNENDEDYANGLSHFPLMTMTSSLTLA
jgi:hypothetical protein